MKRPPHRASTLSFYEAAMRRALASILEQLDAPPPLEELAARVSLSPFHFHRIFRGMVGEPLAAHVRRLRLERAAYALKASDARVVEIALAAGYDSHEAFSRAFKLAYGQTPSAFRRAPGHPTALPSRNAVHYHPSLELAAFRPLHRHSRMKIRLETLSPLRVACVRHCGPYERCGEAWDRLCAWMGKEGYLGPGCHYIGVSYDDPEVTPPEDIRYDACVTVDDAFAPPPDSPIEVQTLAGGAFACTTHHGPYEKFNDTYAHVMGQWVPRQGLRLRDAPCLEFYLNAPDDTPPADLLTDVYIPVHPPSA